MSKEEQDEVLISLVESETRKDRNADIERSFKVLRGETQEEYITSVLESAAESGLGHFIRKHVSKELIYYFCERHYKPKTKSQIVDPTRSRANGCGAYISFTFKYIPSKELYVAITRKLLKHNGHDLSDPEQNRANRLDSQLAKYIENLISQGRKSKEILVLCEDWARERNKTNPFDRRYYPSRRQLSYMLSRSRPRPKKRPRKDHETASEESVVMDAYCTEEVVGDSVEVYQLVDEEGHDLSSSMDEEQVQQMIMQGLAERCLWSDNKECICQVSSPTEMNQLWTVDLSRMTCSCPLQGICRHIEVGLQVADTKNVSIPDARTAIARELFERGEYAITEEFINVYDTNVSTVVDCKHCTCVAASLGIHCICVEVAILVTVNTNANNIQQICEVMVPQEQEIVIGDVHIVQASTQSTESDVNDTLRQQMDEIYTCISSEQIDTHPKKEQIVAAVNKLHALVCPNPSKKRKIETVARIQRNEIAHDHQYEASRERHKQNCIV